MRFSRLASVAGFIVLGIVFGLALASHWETLAPSSAAPEVPRSQLEKRLNESQNLSDTFVLVSKILKPSVVTLFTTAEIKRQAPEFYFGPGEDRSFGSRDPFEFFFGPRSEPGQQPRQYTQKVSGLGSGMLISADGYILTNNHVIELKPGVKVDEVKVRLYGHRKKEYQAKVIASDPRSDIAVIKIDARGLQPVKLGKSSELQAGEWVLAAGAPFGLGHTVSQGIISAFGRRISGAPFAFSNFVQTTAIINPGSSGGPLVNLKGEVVGINAAIATSGAAFRFYQGVGFAIPIDDVKGVIAKLRKGENIVRGYLGIWYREVLESDLEDLKLDKPEGFLINEVGEHSPAARAGLKPGDVILKLGGKTLEDSNALRRTVEQTPPHQTLVLTISRQGKQQIIRVKLASQPQEAPQPGEKAAAETYTDEKLGLVVQALTDDLRETLGYKNRTGVLVTEVSDDSPADQAGVASGDLIVNVNDQPVKNISDYIEAARNRMPSGHTLLRIRRKGEVKFIAIK